MLVIRFSSSVAQKIKSIEPRPSGPVKGISRRSDQKLLPRWIGSDIHWLHPLTIKFSNCLPCTSCCAFVCRAAKIYNFWRRMFVAVGQDALEMASLPTWLLLYGQQLEFKGAFKRHLSTTATACSVRGFMFDVMPGLGLFCQSNEWL